jgi:antibiotic biosynthesis monooxygenase (ABM) superfamily enzyme
VSWEVVLGVVVGSIAGNLLATWWIVPRVKRWLDRRWLERQRRRIREGRLS